VPSTRGRGLSIRLPGGPGAAITARDALADLDGEIPERLLGDLRLLVTELVANAVVHAGASEADLLELDVVLEPGVVQVQVSDGGPGFERPTERLDVERPGGFGLVLVERMARRWGIERGARTRVWFELVRPCEGALSERRTAARRRGDAHGKRPAPAS
jgi:anti-sigma regulatory factor (Ser/Thr protein kinase)